MYILWTPRTFLNLAFWVCKTVTVSLVLNLIHCSPDLSNTYLLMTGGNYRRRLHGGKRSSRTEWKSSRERDCQYGAWPPELHSLLPGQASSRRSAVSARGSTHGALRCRWETDWHTVVTDCNSGVNAKCLICPETVSKCLIYVGSGIKPG